MSGAPRRVLITRPQGQGAGLERALRSQGFEPVALPLFKIEPAGDAIAQRAQLQRARGWDGWLFTSANAARAAAALDDGAWPRLYAIGDATTASLESLGHPGASRAASGSTSEDLLGHAALQSVTGQRFLVCTGVGGRDVLAQGLRARGAQAERLELYRRVPIAYQEAELRDALARSDALICTSGEAVERVLELAPADSRGALLARLLVVPSVRVLELARRLGWSTVRAPASTSDDALVTCLRAT